MFSYYGEIERVRLQKTKTGLCFAFICFKEPDCAAQAKQNLHKQTFDDKVMFINHYEIKEVRDVQKEEALDKADFEKYKAMLEGGFKWDDLSSQPHLT